MIEKNALGQTPEEEADMVRNALGNASEIIVTLRKASGPVLGFYMDLPAEPAEVKRMASLVGLVFTELLGATEALYSIALVLALRDPVVAEKISGWISPDNLKHHHVKKPGAEGLRDTAQEITDEAIRRDFGVENN